MNDQKYKKDGELIVIALAKKGVWEKHDKFKEVSVLEGGGRREQLMN